MAAIEGSQGKLSTMMQGVLPSDQNNYNSAEFEAWKKAHNQSGECQSNHSNSTPSMETKWLFTMFQKSKQERGCSKCINAPSDVKTLFSMQLGDGRVFVSSPNKSRFNAYLLTWMDLFYISLWLMQW